MGERGGLGGGDDGLVIGSAGCTATGDVGTVRAGTEPGRELGAEPAAEVFVDHKMRKSLLATSLKRDMDSSSSDRRSSGSLLRSAERRLLTLGGTTEEDALAGTSAGSICGNVISGRPAGAGEPAEGEPCEEAGGDPSGAVSKGSFSALANRARRLAAAKRMEVAACMSAGGGGRAAHMFMNVRRRTGSSSSAKAGCIFTAAARRVGKRDAGKKASWGPGEGPGGGPPRRGGIQYYEGHIAS